MDRLLWVGEWALSLAVSSLIGATVAAFGSLRPELSFRDGWAAGSNLWLEPEKYLRSERVALVRILNRLAALLGAVGVLSLLAGAIALRLNPGGQP